MPPPASVTNYSPASPNIAADFYLDGTLSMQGFIVDGELTNYQQTIAILERPLIETGGKSGFFKFGTIIQPLPDRNYREADKKTFYQDKSINKTTLIQNVIEAADPQHLTLIVTDLFQEQSDIEILNRLIKEKYLDKEMGVGILSISSQFRGTIYDVGTHNYSFQYPADADSMAQRPFYILGLGKPADIAKYYSGLRNSDLARVAVTNAVVLSRFLVAGYDSFQDSEVTEQKGINDISGSQKIIYEISPHSNFKEFKVRQSAIGSYFSTKVNVKTIEDTIEFGDLHSSISGCVCEGNDLDRTQGDTKGGATSARSVGTDALNVTPTLADKTSESDRNDRSISLRIDVNAGRLELDSTNCFHVQIEPQKFILPTWVAQQNMTGQEIELWKKEPSSFDGSKTFNLQPFLETLMNSSVESRPKVADFYLYLQVK